MPSHRRPPQHRFRGSHGYRRGPARLTLAVAAATTLLVGGVSAGVALAAAPSDVPAGGTSGHVDAAGPGPGSGKGHAQVSDQASQPATAPGQASSRSASAAHTKAPAAHAKSPAAHPTSSASQSQKPAAAAQPYLIYDSLLPGALPSGHVVATYATGPGAVSPAALAGRGPVLWIDVNGTDPGAQVLDVEPGNVTPAAIPGWISAKLSASPSAHAIIYSAINEWPAAQAEVATLPAAMRAQVRWWIADPTGYQHIVPGSDATQWYWGSSYDISTATPRFLSGHRSAAPTLAAPTLAAPTLAAPTLAAPTLLPLLCRTDRAGRAALIADRPTRLGCR